MNEVWLCVAASIGLTVDALRTFTNCFLLLKGMKQVGTFLQYRKRLLEKAKHS